MLSAAWCCLLPGAAAPRQTLCVRNLTPFPGGLGTLITVQASLHGFLREQNVVSFRSDVSPRHSTSHGAVSDPDGLIGGSASLTGIWEGRGLTQHLSPEPSKTQEGAGSTASSGVMSTE